MEVTPDLPADDARPAGGPSETLRLPRHYRLKSPAEFKAVYDRKKSASDGLLIVYAAENGLPHPRLGVSVSRKVGGAVARNRLKRLFREAFRLSRTELPAGVDLVMISRPQASKPTLATVRASLVKLGRLAASKFNSPPGDKPK